MVIHIREYHNLKLTLEEWGMLRSIVDRRILQLESYKDPQAEAVARIYKKLEELRDIITE
jgi:hypothetical protein